MAVESIVEVERLSHRYARDWAIRDIHLRIGCSGILGLLGSNGAGKSTTMNILCGVLSPREGRVRINGIDMQEHPRLAKRHIGFLPQNPPLHLELTVDEYLLHCARLRMQGRQRIRRAVDEAKERCGIAHFSDRLLRHLSGGYRQRAGIAQAIVHEPSLVVLDEPTNGLDPNQIVEVRKLVREIAQERAVIFSTHILPEVQLLCNDIVMIEHGRIVFSDSMEAFNNHIAPDTLMMSLENPPSEHEWLLVEGVTAARTVAPGQVRLSFKSDRSITERLIELSVRRGWRLQEIRLERSTLDQIFAELSQR